jgi:protein CpxP
MKKILFVVVVCAFVGLKSFAQNPNAPKRTAEERANIFVKNMAKEITLSEEQSTKIKTIQFETFKKVDDIREKGMSGDKKEMRQEVKAANDTAEASIKALLTDEQKTKFDAWQEKKREEMKNRQAGGNN